MTGFDATDEEWFEVSSLPDSVTAELGFESSNVCRVAALSTLLGAPAAFTRQVAPELGELGFSADLVNGEQDYRQLDPFRDGADNPLSPGDQPDETRLPLWLALNESRRPRDVLAFMIAVLGSKLERESTAAAAALWREVAPRIGNVPRSTYDRWWRYELLLGPWGDAPLDLDLRPFPDFLSDGGDPDSAEATDWIEWDPEPWQSIFSRFTSRLGSRYDDPFLIGLLARWRLERALRSVDSIVRQLALAALQPSDSDEDDRPPSVAPRASAPGALVVSTMIHGTWGWKGDWWRPRNPFHDFILRSHRPNLFARGARFSWSGAYSDRQRELAALDFIDWSNDVAPHGVQTLFAHSYGGEVAARAMTAGANVHELVLLSSPVTSHVLGTLGLTLGSSTSGSGSIPCWRWLGRGNVCRTTRT